MRATAGRLLLIGVLGVTLVGLVGCGGDKTGGPIGPPGDIVARAPDATYGARTAEVLITATTANARGVVDLARRDGRLAVLAPGHPKAADLVITGGAGYVKGASDPAYVPLGGSVPPVLRGGDPWADIDLVRGTVHVRSDGGAEVDGASTLGYTLTVDPQQAIDTTPSLRQDAVRAALAGRSMMFTMAVWIDSRFRLRRIEVPSDFSFKSTTPPTRVDGRTIATDVDFVAFIAQASPVTRPPGLN
ncbi:MAG: hypothetical protein M3256_08305 [Actinomycetota bacterium]|nr:hypothetical protein [Actinomycetota bacterium]